MAEPFDTLAEKRRSRIGGFTTASRKRAFLAELEAELGRVARIRDLPLERVEALARERRVELESDLPTPRRKLYRVFLEFCLEDHALSEEESADLAHLQRLLHLPDADVRALHDEVARTIYGEAMSQVLEDYQLDAEEAEFLRRLAGQIGIDERSAQEVEAQGRARARQRYLSRAAVHGSGLVAPQGAELELEGSSEAGFQKAVECAVGTAAEALGEIGSAELKALRVDVGKGGVKRWSVRLTSRR